MNDAQSVGNTPGPPTSWASSTRNPIVTGIPALSRTINVNTSAICPLTTVISPTKGEHPPIRASSHFFCIFPPLFESRGGGSRFQSFQNQFIVPAAAGTINWKFKTKVNFTPHLTSCQAWAVDKLGKKNGRRERVCIDSRRHKADTAAPSFMF